MQCPEPLSQPQNHTYQYRDIISIHKHSEGFPVVQEFYAL